MSRYRVTLNVNGRRTECVVNVQDMRTAAWTAVRQAVTFSRITLSRTTARAGYAEYVFEGSRLAERAVARVVREPYALEDAQ